jgi:hypothetical protein
MSWHEKFEIADLSTTLAEVIPPRDLETRPHRVITFEVYVFSDCGTRGKLRFELG